ncbi:MAG: polysaccharide lyase [Cyanobacteria bacterium J06631_2]
MHKKNLLIFTVIFVIIVASGITAQETIFKDDFELAKIEQWDQEFCCEHSVDFVTVTENLGQERATYLKFELRKNDPELNLGKRSELALKSVSLSSLYTYSFSLFLPRNYEADRSFEILAQWHGLPDFELGETWRSPPLALRTENGRFKLERNWDEEQVTVNSDRQQELIDLGAYTPGKLTDWQFQVFWSPQADGSIKVWQNNALVWSHQGANTYNDRQGPYFKIGIYKPDWKYQPEKSSVSNRTVYFDDVLITNN